MFWRGTTVETGLVPPEKGCCGGTGWAKAITSWRAGGCCQKMVARVEKQRKAICQVLTADKKKHLVLPWQQTDLLGVHEQYSQVNSEVHRFLVWHIFNLLNSFELLLKLYLWTGTVSATNYTSSSTGSALPDFNRAWFFLHHDTPPSPCDTLEL